MKEWTSVINEENLNNPYWNIYLYKFNDERGSGFKIGKADSGFNNRYKNADTNVKTETETAIEETQDEQVEDEVVEDKTPTTGIDKDLNKTVDLDAGSNDNFNYEDFSSRPEFPSLYSAIESLPMEQHSQFATLLASGNVSITCN